MDVPAEPAGDPSLVLVTDLNDWSPAEGKTFAPHVRGGPVVQGQDFANTGQQGLSSADIGAQGGNVGLVDGSVAWKPMTRMRVYSSSLKWGDGGCHAAW